MLGFNTEPQGFPRQNNEGDLGEFSSEEFSMQFSVEKEVQDKEKKGVRPTWEGGSGSRGKENRPH